ncbi:hypothetical protein ACFCXP_37555 [Streptomyces niveus]|uniref:hypothetical protein n=1 Tax=Streptomyces niveus TaxID=193462 RepID=UPI0035E28969
MKTATSYVRGATTFQKKLALAALLLVLVALPGLVTLVAVPAAAILVWVSAQPLLVGAAIGAFAVPRVRLEGR